MKTFPFALCPLIFLMMLLAGCGVEDVSAPKDPLTAKTVQWFPKENWRLVNNKLFLWRKDMTWRDVSRARAIGDEIDDLDGKALPLNRKQFELEALLDPISQAITHVNKHLRAFKRAHSKLQSQVGKLKQSISKIEGQIAAEKSKPSPDKATVDKLMNDQATLQIQLTAAQSNLEEFGPFKDGLDEDLAELNAQAKPLQEKLDVVLAKQAPIETRGRERVNELMTFVEYFKDQPSAVTFQFETDGSISSSIVGWNVGDGAGPRTFSTSPGPGGKPTIAKVTYQESGGIFQFDVYVFKDESQKLLSQTYSFNVSRINYDATDGRKFFGGEIIRTTDVNGVKETRRGIAKLVDRNN